MEPIPGSALVSPRLERADENTKLNRLVDAANRSGWWWSTPRWGGGPKPPMTIARVQAIAMKREGLVRLPDGSTSAGGRGERGRRGAQKRVAIVPLAECVSGSELVAGYRSHELFPFPLEQRRGRVHVPTTSTPMKWHMRAPHVKALAWFAAGMIGLKRKGVVIAHKELAELIGLRDRQTGTVVRQLCAWGLLRSTPVFVAKGCVTSQRASLYRLTTAAAHVWRLKVPAACGELPEPDHELPRERAAKAAARAAIARPTATVSGVAEPLPAIRQQLPANPETSLREDTSGERGALQWAERPSAGVVSEPAAVPDESPVPFQPGRREDASCDVLSRLYKPESGELAAAPLSSDLDDLRKLPAGQKAPARRTTPLERWRDERGIEERWRENLDYVDERGRAPKRAPARDYELDDDGPGGRSGVDPATQAAIRRYRDSLVDEGRRDFDRVQPPVRRPRPDDGVADDIEKAWKTWSETKGRGDSIPQNAFKVLQQLRRSDDETGGAK